MNREYIPSVQIQTLLMPIKCRSSPSPNSQPLSIFTWRQPVPSIQWWKEPWWASYIFLCFWRVKTWPQLDLFGVYTLQLQGFSQVSAVGKEELEGSGQGWDWEGTSEGSLSVLLLIYLIGEMECVPGWYWTYCVTKDDLELLFLFPPHHSPPQLAYAVLGMESKVLWMLGKHYSKWGTS